MFLCSVRYPAVPFMMVDPVTKLQHEKRDIVVEFSLGYPDMTVLGDEQELRNSIIRYGGWYGCVYGWVCMK